MDNILNIITELILAVVPIIITSVVVPWIKAAISEKQLEKALQMVDIGVGAAEQLAAVNGKTGAWKKEYVLHFLQNKGINIDEDTLDKMIEASVLLLRKELEQ